MRTESLRSCPTCGGKPKENLGLRDYASWLNKKLPGRVGGSDIDCVLEQHKTGRLLMMEFKPKGEALPTGQRLLLQAFVKLGVEVWVCWEDGDNVEVGLLTKDGLVPFISRMTKTELEDRAYAWWGASQN